MNEGTNNRSPIKKLACAATSSAKQAKIKIKTASTFSCGTGLFFFALFITAMILLFKTST